MPPPYNNITLAGLLLSLPDIAASHAPDITA
jgi:hypothetical protein